MTLQTETLPSQQPCVNTWCANGSVATFELALLPGRDDLTGSDDRTWACPECGAIFTLDRDGALWPARLVCPHHPAENADLSTRVYMIEFRHNVNQVFCPKCDSESQNFVRLPVAAVADLNTGRVLYRNMLTGQYV